MSTADGAGLPPGSKAPPPLQTLSFWAQPFAHFERCRRRYGPRFTFRAVGYPPWVFLSDPGEIKAMFAAPQDELCPGVASAPIQPIVGDASFMLADDALHRQGRRAVAPRFNAEGMHRQGGLVGHVVERHVRSWPRGRTFALQPRLRALSLEIILRMIFGLHGDVRDERLAALHRKLLEMLVVTGGPLLIVPRLRHGPAGRSWRNFLRARAEADQLIDSLLSDCGFADGLGDSAAGIPHAYPPDNSLGSFRCVRDNIMSLILAGHETTSAQLAWAFQLLAHYPSVLQKLTAECDVGESEDYMTATIYETLRHRPVFLFTMPRAVMHPVDIGDWTYRPSTHLLACLYLVHHDPSFYPDPHNYRPERFLEAHPDRAIWMPWGGGPRRCLGLHLAMLEMKTVIRTVLTTTALRPPARRPEPARWRSVIVVPSAGARVVLEPRIL